MKYLIFFICLGLNYVFATNLNNLNERFCSKYKNNNLQEKLYYSSEDYRIFKSRYAKNKQVIVGEKILLNSKNFISLAQNGFISNINELEIQANEIVVDMDLKFKFAKLTLKANKVVFTNKGSIYLQDFNSGIEILTNLLIFSDSSKNPFMFKTFEFHNVNSSKKYINIAFNKMLINKVEINQSSYEKFLTDKYDEIRFLCTDINCADFNFYLRYTINLLTWNTSQSYAELESDYFKNISISKKSNKEIDKLLANTKWENYVAQNLINSHSKSPYNGKQNNILMERIKAFKPMFKKKSPVAYQQLIVLENRIIQELDSNGLSREMVPSGKFDDLFNMYKREIESSMKTLVKWYQEANILSKSTSDLSNSDKINFLDENRQKLLNNFNDLSSKYSALVREQDEIIVKKLQLSQLISLESQNLKNEYERLKDQESARAEMESIANATIMLSSVVTGGASTFLAGLGAYGKLRVMDERGELNLENVVEVYNEYRATTEKFQADYKKVNKNWCHFKKSFLGFVNSQDNVPDCKMPESYNDVSNMPNSLKLKDKLKLKQGEYLYDSGKKFSESYNKLISDYIAKDFNRDINLPMSKKFSELMLSEDKLKIKLIKVGEKIVENNQKLLSLTNEIQGMDFKILQLESMSLFNESEVIEKMNQVIGIKDDIASNLFINISKVKRLFSFYYGINLDKELVLRHFSEDLFNKKQETEFDVCSFTSPEMDLISNSNIFSEFNIDGKKPITASDWQSFIESSSEINCANLHSAIYLRDLNNLVSQFLNSTLQLKEQVKNNYTAVENELAFTTVINEHLNKKILDIINSEIENTIKYKNGNYNYFILPVEFPDIMNINERPKFLSKIEFDYKFTEKVNEEDTPILTITHPGYGLSVGNGTCTQSSMVDFKKKLNVLEFSNGKNITHFQAYPLHTDYLFSVNTGHISHVIPRLKEIKIRFYNKK